MKSSTVTNGHKTHARTPRSYEGLTRDDLLAAYRWMVLSRRLDDKEIQLKNQSQIFFQISGAGHEAILVAAGLTLKPSYDWFFPYYRDRALTLMLGMTPYEMLLSAVGSSEDPTSAGRMMPSHWSSPALHIMNRSSATGMQCLQGAGSAEASKRLPLLGEPTPPVEQDEVTYVSIGDGATGEGEFWEFMNTICTEQLPMQSRALPTTTRPVETSHGSWSRSRTSKSSASTARTSSRATGRCARRLRMRARERDLRSFTRR
jgi:2-oxoisovalerate dehydrogenase E1 component